MIIHNGTNKRQHSLPSPCRAYPASSKRPQRVQRFIGESSLDRDYQLPGRCCRCNRRYQAIQTTQRSNEAQERQEEDVRYYRTGCKHIHCSVQCCQIPSQVHRPCPYVSAYHTIPKSSELT